MASVLVPIAEGCEELEAVTILDLLVRAGVHVISAGLEPGPVTCSRGTILVPSMTLDQAMAEDYDMIVLPGGLPGADHLDKDERIQSLLASMSGDNKYIAAICAAPKVLATAGLLNDKKITSYPGVFDKIDIPGMIYDGGAVIKDGTIITSRGPGTAMDFSLMLIEVLVGKEKRDEVESGLVRDG
ncbi:MAG: DJ-1/PfpI family protein [Gammaproteobacteria bacterium]|nr:DJ-1/PfpI family protein [Gammaproteobacteria bacterium]